MKFLTLHEPWATLIAEGHKWIETRSWSTHYRGPLAIHAGMAWPTLDLGAPLIGTERSARTRWSEPLGRWRVRQIVTRRPGGSIIRQERDLVDVAANEIIPLRSFGMVVAVADLVDVVPIGHGFPSVHDHVLHPQTNQPEDDHPRGIAGLWYCTHDGARHAEDQRPFGDFAPLRYAWILDNVRRPTAPIPLRGARGIQTLPPDVEDALDLPEGAAA